MPDLRRDPTEAALSRMLRQHAVEDVSLMERMNRPKATIRLAADAVAEETLSSVADALVGALPQFVSERDREQRDGSVVVAFDIDGFDDDYGDMIAVVSGAFDATGASWVVIGGGYLTGTSADDVVTDEDIQDLVTALNDTFPAGTWGTIEGSVALTAAAVLPLRDATDRDNVSLAAELVMNAAGYGSYAVRAVQDQPPETPLYALAKQAEAFNISSGNVHTVRDLAAAISTYLSRLPGVLASTAEVQHHPLIDDVPFESVTLSVPFNGRPEFDSVSVRFSLPSIELESATMPHGLHALAKVPALMPKEEASLWCQRLNGSDGDATSEFAITTSYQYGNWYHTEHEKGLHDILYFAVVPHSMRGRLDLADEVEGIVKEVSISTERILFARRYTQMLAGSAGPGELAQPDAKGV